MHTHLTKAQLTSSFDRILSKRVTWRKWTWFAHLIFATIIGLFPGSASAAVDKVVFADAHGRATTASFSTSAANELLVALVSSDGPSSGGQAVTVTGAGLT